MCFAYFVKQNSLGVSKGISCLEKTEIIVVIQWCNVDATTLEQWSLLKMTLIIPIDVITRLGWLD